ncbi:hypothetical protein BKA70DRAFT_1131920, partial [Coprinopsis sp. MPI-PUGE-AT-0042]
WDGWPDGPLELDLTWSEFDAKKNLMVHWTTKGGSGDRKGKDTASFWEAGKKSTRQCCGYLGCMNESCKVIVRAQTTPQGRAKQLGKQCRCGSDLAHFECSNSDRMYKWKGGIVYENPGARPLQLIVGLRRGSGHGKSVADISSVLTNRDRVGKELQQIRRGQGPDAFLKEFEDFAASHPNFIAHSRLDEFIVISLQTDWMRSQSLAFDVGVQTARDVEDAVSGTLSDAAHGWWRDRHRLLVVSSVFSPAADRWVPVLFSYTNGATSAHYKEHFLVLMKAIANRALSLSLSISYGSGF